MKDESDVVRGVVKHMATQVDGMIIADNGSTDGTREALAELAETLPVPLLVVDDPEVAYRQAQKMSHLAEMAAERRGGGPVGIVPFDADELWSVSATTPGCRPRVADLFTLHPDRDIFVADLYHHVATDVDQPAPGPNGEWDPFATMRYRRDLPQPLSKVAFRWRPGAVIEQGNHGVQLPGPPPRVAPATDTGLQVNHFPYRDEEQFARKVINGYTAIKAAPELPEYSGAHWRAYGRLHEQGGPGALEDLFLEHHWIRDPDREPGLVEAPAPYLAVRS